MFKVLRVTLVDLNLLYFILQYPKESVFFVTY